VKEDKSDGWVDMRVLGGVLGWLGMGLGWGWFE
jgi:hypothetical protein